jgi:hypothetical protein
VVPHALYTIAPVKIGLFSLLVPLVVAVLAASSPVALPQAAAPPSSEEITQLRVENAKLRAENQRLRQLLIQGGAATTPASPAPRSSASPYSSPSAAATTSTDRQGLTHWLTSSSSKRHNASCRYFQSSKGRPCTATEGIPCKICGG